MQGATSSRLSMLSGTSLHKGVSISSTDIYHCLRNHDCRYKDAAGALRRRQDKEREAAGMPPVQRVGARGATGSQFRQRGATTRGYSGSRSSALPLRGGGGRGGGPPRTIHSDKNVYVHLLGHLKKENLLPVVVFTFSKKRCEENAGTLTNADLCTSVEKSEVHVAIEKALSRLKGGTTVLVMISLAHKVGRFR